MARRERLLRAKLKLPQGLIERAAQETIPQGLKPKIRLAQTSARLKPRRFKAPKLQAKATAAAKGKRL
jgi:hypothetical protein